MAAKIDNVEGAWPQAGLNQADIVFDIPVEGGLTRLLAIFHSQDVAQFGPIRSGRPVDADLLHLLGHAYYAFSGGTPFDLGPISDHSNATALSWSIYPDLFVIRNDHRIPHQVFGTTSMLYAGGQQFAPSTTPPDGDLQLRRGRTGRRRPVYRRDRAVRRRDRRVDVERIPIPA